MKIVDCKKTRKTGRLVRSMVPYSLKDKSIILNLGSRRSMLEWIDYDWIINSAEAVRNCSDKIRMFRILGDNEVSCLKFYIRKPNVSYRRYVFRIGKRIKVGYISGEDYDYCTRFEDKDKEWRVVVFKGKVLRAMEKVPHNKTDIWKQKDCRFRHVDDYMLPSEIKSLCLKACKVLGIDLAGVDILRNVRGEYKVIEVNSGMAMGERTIGRLFGAIEEEVRRR